MSVSCDPGYLANQSACFTCIPEGNKLNILIYLFATIGAVTTDPETLANLSKCFVCIPPGKKMDVLLYLACQLANESAKVCILGGTGPPAVAVPCDFSAYVEQPGPNFGLWLGDLSTGWSEVIAQGP